MASVRGPDPCLAAGSDPDCVTTNRVRDTTQLFAFFFTPFFYDFKGIKIKEKDKDKEKSESGSGHFWTDTDSGPGSGPLWSGF